MAEKKKEEGRKKKGKRDEKRGKEVIFFFLEREMLCLVGKKKGGGEMRLGGGEDGSQWVPQLRAERLRATPIVVDKKGEMKVVEVDNGCLLLGQGGLLGLGPEILITGIKQYRISAIYLNADNLKVFTLDSFGTCTVILKNHLGRTVQVLPGSVISAVKVKQRPDLMDAMLDFWDTEVRFTEEFQENYPKLFRKYERRYNSSICVDIYSKGAVLMDFFHDDEERYENEPWLKVSKLKVGHDFYLTAIELATSNGIELATSNRRICIKKAFYQLRGIFCDGNGSVKYRLKLASTNEFSKFFVLLDDEQYPIAAVDWLILENREGVFYAHVPQTRLDAKVVIEPRNK